MGIKTTPAVAEAVIRVTREENWLPAGQPPRLALTAVHMEGWLTLNLGGS